MVTVEGFIQCGLILLNSVCNVILLIKASIAFFLMIKIVGFFFYCNVQTTCNALPSVTFEMYYE